MRIIEVAARVAAAVVELEGAGEVADQMEDLAREEEMAVAGTTMTTTTPMELLVVVQDVAVVGVGVVELEGDEERHHPHHHPGHRLLQTYWTRTFSLVSLSFILHTSRLKLMEHRR